MAEFLFNGDEIAVGGNTRTAKISPCFPRDYAVGAASRDRCHIKIDSPLGIIETVEPDDLMSQLQYGAAPFDICFPRVGLPTFYLNAPHDNTTPGSDKGGISILLPAALKDEGQICSGGLAGIDPASRAGAGFLVAG